MINYQNISLKIYMNNKQILGSLAMDLKRVALGLHRGSLAMSVRFEQEAGKRLNEVEQSQLLPYMKEVLGKIKNTLSAKNSDRKAEDILML